MASHRFPLDIKQIRAYAWAILFRSGQPEKFCKPGPSEKWWRGFKKHHHEVKREWQTVLLLSIILKL